MGELNQTIFLSLDFNDRLDTSTSSSSSLRVIVTSIIWHAFLRRAERDMVKTFTKSKLVSNPLLPCIATPNSAKEVPDDISKRIEQQIMELILNFLDYRIQNYRNHER